MRHVRCEQLGQPREECFTGNLVVVEIEDPSAPTLGVQPRLQ